MKNPHDLSEEFANSNGLNSHLERLEREIAERKQNPREEVDYIAQFEERRPSPFMKDPLKYLCGLFSGKRG